jgi:hypothetical protein
MATTLPPLACEPFRIWNRLEGRGREVEFQRALQAEVHDPLWMLARQWQFGEFKGEDTGSAVTAKLARTVAPIDGVRAGGQSFEPYSAELPLEARVERLPLEPAPVARAALGRLFLKRLDSAAKSLPGSATPYDPAHYRDLMRQAFPLSTPQLDPNDPADALAVAHDRSALPAQRMLMALAGRAFDGFLMYAALKPGMTWADLPGQLGVGVEQGHSDMVLNTLEDFRAWFASTFAAPPPGESAWQPSGLEYSFDCTVPRTDGSKLTLRADAFSSGALDWYSFDLGPSIGKSGAAAGGATTEVRSVIPTPAEFAGMPNPRWWQFEDGNVDLGNISADATDLAKVLVAEFALLYGNNWFVVPYAQRAATLAEIQGIVVSDVFGWRTFVQAATGSSGGDWARWDFFSLSEKPGAQSAPSLGQHLFLPPVVPRVDDREPVESVAFVRDETTNMVWAVETRVPDGLGGGRDGGNAARRFKGALDQLEQSLGGNGTPVTEDPEAQLRYRAGTTVPENWIPLIPVHKPQDTREIRLQRAAMPRFFLGQTQPVRPITTILRPGIDPDDSQSAPYFVNEEEVPAAGLVVDGGPRRTRWLGGVVAIWNGRRRRSGRGEGGSGLRWDAIEKTGDKT